MINENDAKYLATVYIIGGAKCSYAIVYFQPGIIRYHTLGPDKFEYAERVRVFFLSSLDSKLYSTTCLTPFVAAIVC